MLSCRANRPKPGHDRVSQLCTTLHSPNSCKVTYPVVPRLFLTFSSFSAFLVSVSSIFASFGNTHYLNVYLLLFSDSPNFSVSFRICLEPLAFLQLIVVFPTMRPRQPAASSQLCKLCRKTRRNEPTDQEK